jgi:hypothetical protein
MNATSNKILISTYTSLSKDIFGTISGPNVCSGRHTGGSFSLRASPETGQKYNLLPVIFANRFVRFRCRCNWLAHSRALLRVANDGRKKERENQ